MSGYKTLTEIKEEHGVDVVVKHKQWVRGESMVLISVFQGQGHLISDGSTGKTDSHCASRREWSLIKDTIDA
jgi:hypothetical protein